MEIEYTQEEIDELQKAVGKPKTQIDKKLDVAQPNQTTTLSRDTNKAEGKEPQSGAATL